MYVIMSVLSDFVILFCFLSVELPDRGKFMILISFEAPPSLRFVILSDIRTYQNDLLFKKLMER